MICTVSNCKYLRAEKSNCCFYCRDKKKSTSSAIQRTKAERKQALPDLAAFFNRSGVTKKVYNQFRGNQLEILEHLNGRLTPQVRYVNAKRVLEKAFSDGPPVDEFLKRPRVDRNLKFRFLAEDSEHPVLAATVPAMNRILDEYKASIDVVEEELSEGDGGEAVMPEARAYVVPADDILPVMMANPALAFAQRRTLMEKYCMHVQTLAEMKQVVNVLKFMEQLQKESHMALAKLHKQAAESIAKLHKQTAKSITEVTDTMTKRMLKFLPRVCASSRKGGIDHESTHIQL